MNWLQFVVAALQALPAVITAVETVIGAGNGTTKKAAVVNTVTSSATVAGATPEQVASLAVVAGVVTDATVASLNAAGVFTTSKKTS